MDTYIFLGGPGSGKGTQAELLSKKLNIPHISTGQIFRDHMEHKTPLGLQIEKTMDSGNLVSDEIVVQVIEERLNNADCKNGAILDGTPRTLEQAKELDRISLNILKVFYIHVDEHELVMRVSGRRVCEQEGHTFHTKFNPPKLSDICDIDGSKLVQREEDHEEAFKVRLKLYHKLTEPLIDFYKNKGVLSTINGNPSIEEIHTEILTFLSLHL